MTPCRKSSGSNSREKKSLRYQRRVKTGWVLGIITGNAQLTCSSLIIHDLWHIEKLVIRRYLVEWLIMTWEVWLWHSFFKLTCSSLIIYAMMTCCRFGVKEGWKNQINSIRGRFGSESWNIETYRQLSVLVMRDSASDVTTWSQHYIKSILQTRKCAQVLHAQKKYVSGKNYTHGNKIR